MRILCRLTPKVSGNFLLVVPHSGLARTSLIQRREQFSCFELVRDIQLCQENVSVCVGLPKVGTSGCVFVSTHFALLPSPKFFDFVPLSIVVQHAQDAAQVVERFRFGCCGNRTCPGDILCESFV